jgi:acetoin utilization protein AcuC
MHEASSAVAGGSIRAMEAILRGDVEHAQHPGGGLHHAMAARASGFCVYNDPALAIARARHDGLRVLYVDLDVHHGDGVQALFYDDPGVLTFSIHETGRALFPGTGEAWEIGAGVAAASAVNVPLPPGTGEGAWLGAVRRLLPELAAAFGPDVIVSQHGADAHAWDPLAHLRVTTTAMGEAARLVDALAHRHGSRGRWLATGGGGYDAYRVVPRAWALTWLAGAHREVPAATPEAWRTRWQAEAARYGQSPLPTTFDDPPNAGLPVDAEQVAAESDAVELARLVRRVVVPRLVREATDRHWWDPLGAPRSGLSPSGAGPGAGTPTIVPAVDAGTWSRLALEPWVIPPAAPSEAHAIVLTALAEGATVSAAVVGASVVGLAIASADGELLALGVASAWRRQGLASRLLAAAETARSAEVTVAERDPVEPLDRGARSAIARRLLGAAGFRLEPAPANVRAIDPEAIVAVRP